MESPGGNIFNFNDFSGRGRGDRFRPVLNLSLFYPFASQEKSAGSHCRPDKGAFHFSVYIFHQLSDGKGLGQCLSHLPHFIQSEAQLVFPVMTPPALPA